MYSLFPTPEGETEELELPVPSEKKNKNNQLGNYEIKCIYLTFIKNKQFWYLK